MVLPFSNVVKSLRAWFAARPTVPDPVDPEICAEVQSHLDERRAEMSHWLFLVRAGLALGLAGYLAFSALMSGGALPAVALGAAAYAAVNAAVRFTGGRHFRAAPWAYALIDFAVILLLYGLFAFSTSFSAAPVGPNVALVGLLALVLLVYTVLGSPKLNAVFSLASLAAMTAVLYLAPDFAADRALAGSPPPVRSFLLVEYLSIACLVTCLLALRLRRRITAHSTEMYRRMAATVESTIEQKRREELEEVNHLKRDFISVLSHELRNPVTPLISSLEIVQADMEDGHSDPELIEVAADAAHQLQDLIRDYTRLAELLNRPLDKANRWNVPLRPLVETVVEQIDGSRFIFEDLKDRTVAGEPSMLCGALHAVMRRAAQHTPAGRLITVRATESTEDTLSVAVHDPSTYLEPETIEALNDLFAPSQERLFSKESTGLELILAQHALHRVDGRLRVESSREAGTTVHCLLPMASPKLSRLAGEPLRALCTERLPEKRAVTS